MQKKANANESLGTALAQEVCRESEAKGFANDLPSFSDCLPDTGSRLDPVRAYDFAQMLEFLRAMQQGAAPRLERPLEVPKRRFGKIFLFVQRGMRKLMRFYISPYAKEQQNFNFAATRFCFQAARYDMEHEGMKERLREQEKAIRSLRRELEVLQAREKL